MSELYVFISQLMFPLLHVLGELRHDGQSIVTFMTYSFQSPSTPLLPLPTLGLFILVNQISWTRQSVFLLWSVIESTSMLLSLTQWSDLSSQGNSHYTSGHYHPVLQSFLTFPFRPLSRGILSTVLNYQLIISRPISFILYLLSLPNRLSVKLISFVFLVSSFHNFW